MTDWETVRFGDICEIDRQRSNGAPLPFVGLENIEGGTGRLTANPERASMKSSTFTFDASHILYGRLRPYLNKVFLPDFAGHCSSEIIPLRCTDRVDRRFLAHLLMSDSMVARIDATSTGTRMPRADLKQMMNFEIAIPGLTEQARVAAIMDEAFEAIDTGIASAEKNLANSFELFESILNSRCVPKDDWFSRELQTDVKFIDYRGRTPKKTKTGTRLITAKNVRMGFIQQDPQEFVDPAIYQSWMTRGIPRLGDVLFTTEAPLGLVAQLDTDEKVVFAQRLITLAPDRSRIDPTMLHYVLRSSDVQRRIHDDATGATARGIKASLLKKIQIAMPQHLDDQLQIGRELAEAERRCKALGEIQRRRAEEYASLRSSFMSQAIGDAASQVTV